MEQPQTIFNFIIDALKISGSSYNIINSELIMAQCQVAIPRTFFSQARLETLNLQMVCTPEIINQYPGSELVIKGSYRLQWFIDGIRERGLITSGTFHYDLDPRKIQREITSIFNESPRFFFEAPNLTYQPELLVLFRVSYETDEITDELYDLGINLVNGEISSHLIQELASKKISPKPPKKNLEKRKISYREGFNSLLNHLKWQLQLHDSNWIQTAKTRWEEEVNYLESFYRGDHMDELTQNDDEASFYRRLAESYRKYQPVIKIQIVNVAVLYLPVIRYTIESYEGKKLSALIYDPIRRKISQVNPNRQNDTE